MFAPYISKIKRTSGYDLAAEHKKRVRIDAPARFFGVSVCSIAEVESRIRTLVALTNYPVFRGCCGFASASARCFVALAGRSLLDAVDLLSSAGARSMGDDRSAIMPAIPTLTSTDIPTR